MRGARCLTLVTLVLLATAARAEDPRPLALLEAMAGAGQSIHYRGSFTYEHSNSMESFRVFHWVDDGRAHDRVEALNGPESSLQRLGPGDTCQPLGYRLLQTGPTETGEAASDDGSAPELDRLDNYYQLSLRGEERIAGRPTYTLEVRPRDLLRYGYILNIDQETGLLLRSLLIDENHGVLERFQFVELELEDEADTVRREAKSLPGETASSPDCDTRSPKTPSDWMLSWVPPGFVFSGERQLAEDIDMLMYTDGLASFSVFLQPFSGQISVEGRAKSGATSAFMGQLAAGARDFRVTVVGEIPVHVAEQLARGISPRLLPALQD